LKVHEGLMFYMPLAPRDEMIGFGKPYLCCAYTASSMRSVDQVSSQLVLNEGVLYSNSMGSMGLNYFHSGVIKVVRVLQVGKIGDER
jgi:hypothetical protein